MPPASRSELPPDPALDPLTLSFQLKLLWLAGYLPHLASCAGCGRPGALVAFSAAAGGGVCVECAGGALPLSAAGFRGVRGLLERPLGEARQARSHEQGRTGDAAGDRSPRTSTTAAFACGRLPPADG